MPSGDAHTDKLDLPRRVLVVDDDKATQHSIALALASMSIEVSFAASIEDAIGALAQHPEVMFLDLRLPDGSGIEVAEAARVLRPMPRIIVLSGESAPEDAFRLAQLGARRYLAKPAGLHELQAALQQTWNDPPDLTAVSAQCVGPLGLAEASELVRRTMTEQALAIARGNRTRAASLLGISRQAMQQVVRRREEVE